MAALEYIARGVSLLPGRKCIVYFSEGSHSLFDDRMGTGDSRGAGSGRIWAAMDANAVAGKRRRRGDLHGRCAADLMTRVGGRAR